MIGYLLSKNKKELCEYSSVHKNETKLKITKAFFPLPGQNGKPGSSLAGGNWNLYEKEIEEFAFHNPEIEAVMYKL